MRSDPGAAARVLGTERVGTGLSLGSVLREGSPSHLSTQRPLNVERNNLASDRSPRAQYPVCKHNAESLTMPERLTTGD